MERASKQQDGFAALLLVVLTYLAAFLVGPYGSAELQPDNREPVGEPDEVRSVGEPGRSGCFKGSGLFDDLYLLKPRL